MSLKYLRGVMDSRQEQPSLNEERAYSHDEKVMHLGGVNDFSRNNLRRFTM